MRARAAVFSSRGGSTRCCGLCGGRAVVGPLLETTPRETLSGILPACCSSGSDFRRTIRCATILRVAAQAFAYAVHLRDGYGPACV